MWLSQKGIERDMETRHLSYLYLFTLMLFLFARDFNHNIYRIAYYNELEFHDVTLKYAWKAGVSGA